MTSLLQKMATLTVVSTLAIAVPALATPLDASVGIAAKQRGINSGSSVLRDFGEVRGVGEFIVLRDSYASNGQSTRQFEAIVDGSRQIWRVDCRRGDLSTGRWSAPRNSSTAEVITFVCTDRYLAGTSGSSGGSTYDSRPPNLARVTQATDAVASNGRPLFSFFEGEQIQVDWGDRRSINGREYVAAIDSVGQAGYIRTDRIDRQGNGGVGPRPTRPSGNRLEAASVVRETPAVSAAGQELFYFYEGEQIQVNWGDRRSINGREYVAAIDSVGQTGYIQTGQVRGSRSGDVTPRTDRQQWQQATVSRETPGVSETGEELFFFYAGEQIQINRNGVVRLDGQDYVEALDSVGQRGYIRVDRVR